LPPSTSKQVELTFTREPDSALKVDYYDVRVFEVAGGLVLKKTYVLADPATPSIQIDRGLFIQNHEYALQIRAFRGQRNAANGDFVPVMYPQYATSVVMATFVAQ
jgi:hypothetical protein